MKQTSLNGRCKVVVSGVIVNIISSPAKAIDPCSQNAVGVPELNLYIEEADMRIINRINWSVKRGFTTVVVFSKDTDVVVLLLHYYNEFRRRGLKQIWFKKKTIYFHPQPCGYIRIAVLSRHSSTAHRHWM